ncbi:MAG: SDR family NAD(P)-dependent oxidoreductase, partial [Actinomycetota bacterium]
MELEGSVAVVTGGAVRLGRSISLALADEGAAVFIHYNRSAGPAEALRDEIIASGGTAAIGPGDLSDPRKAGEIITEATEALGPVSLLVNS